MNDKSSIRMEWTPEVGMARHELYKGAMKQLKNALEKEFYIEAVALCESVISDRLEARISFLNNHSIESRKQRSLRALLKYLRSTDSPKQFPKLSELYKEIEDWRHQRNGAIHNAVKLTDGDVFETWNERYLKIEDAAITGHKLAKKLSGELKSMKDKAQKKSRETAKQAETQS